MVQHQPWAHTFWTLLSIRSSIGIPLPSSSSSGSRPFLNCLYHRNTWKRLITPSINNWITLSSHSHLVSHKSWWCTVGRYYSYISMTRTSNTDRNNSPLLENSWLQTRIDREGSGDYLHGVKSLPDYCTLVKKSVSWLNCQTCVCWHKFS